MKLLIDNQDFLGAVDYTGKLEWGAPPQVKRTLNAASTMTFRLATDDALVRVPGEGARVWWQNDGGVTVFAGWITGAPQEQLAGESTTGAVRVYSFEAMSDEYVLDRAALPEMLPVSAAAAKEVVAQITCAAGGSEFDLSRVADTGEVRAMHIDAGENWSDVVARVASTSHATYRAEEMKLTVVPVGETSCYIDADSDDFARDGLTVERPGHAISDWTIVGEVEPSMYVKDYFFGDGHTLRFPMSQQPFLRPSVTWLEEEYAGELPAEKWAVEDASGAVTVSGGKLRVAGGSGRDGETVVRATNALELGGCWVMEHGAVVAGGACDAMVGGLYDGDVTSAKCVAGFRLSGTAGALRLQPLVRGAAAGASTAIIEGHRYSLTTRVSVSEVHRVRQIWRSSRGSDVPQEIAADARFVLEVRDLDAGAGIAPAVVLFDEIVTDAPALALYAVVNAATMQGTINYTRLRQVSAAEVRTSSASTGPIKTRIVGALNEGAECSITTEPAVYFYSPFKPASGDEIVVSYRASARAAARVCSELGVAHGRAAIARAEAPLARSSEDCQAAAERLLDDSVQLPQAFSYETWQELLPNGDVRPGDRVEIASVKHAMNLNGIARTVTVTASESGDHARVRIECANDALAPVAVRLSNDTSSLKAVPDAIVAGTHPFVGDLPNAAVTNVELEVVTADTGVEAPYGGGFEVRREGDFGWGAAVDRNLIGRYTQRTIALPRSTRAEDYYLRMYDAAGNYSRHTTLLHVDVRDDAI